MSGKHSPLGASASYRWLNCPGSVNLIRDLDIKGETSEYAAEGTVAHEIAAECWLQQREPWEYAGETRKADGFEFTVDAAMVDAVQLWLDTIRADMERAEPPFYTHVEGRVSLNHEHPDLWGTLDFAIRDQKLVRVYDFKYGAGIPVDPEQNTQLMQYAAGVLSSIDLAESPDEIELVIVQPRAPHSRGPVRRWRLAREELWDWVNDVLVPGAKRTDDFDAPCVAGPWCDKNFCPARGRCEAYTEQGGTAIISLMEEDQPESSIRAMSDERLGELLDLRPAIGQFLKALQAECDRRMLAGGTVPGQKVVYGIVHRKWKDDAEPALKKGLGKDAYTQPKLISPAAAEKLGAKAKKLVAEWAFKPPAPLTTAPASDRREAVKLEDADAIFGDLIE